MSHDPKSVSGTGNESDARIARLRENPGIRTHVLLVFAMALVIATVTSVSMLLIRHRLRAEVTDNLSRDLDHSVITFQNLEAERMGALERENALLADLPTLKALMTSGDDLTIQDGAVEFWRISDNDLFALADANGRVVAVYTEKGEPDATLRAGLNTLLSSPEKHYLIDGRWLYACSLRPLYFGGQNGSLLGYVISGVSIEPTVRQISQPTGVEATFVSGGQVVASTLDPTLQRGLAAKPQILGGKSDRPWNVDLGNARFLAAAEDLTPAATAPLELVVLKSFEPAEHTIHHIDRIVLLAGLLALLTGTALMLAFSRIVTLPLEELSQSVRAFGIGDVRYRIPRRGTREVRQLSTAFAAMRDEIQQVNRALLESERLATIGRMASSVSHDLRHYLAAVYANAEFLASDRVSPKDRAEIFADIRAAVHGTTDMIESLLIFSRTGKSVRRVPELMATLLERAASMARNHPDAAGITLVLHYGDPTESSAVVDGKQIERAIFNLLLNACQSLRAAGKTECVVAALETHEQQIILNVTDNGVGVPESIRHNLFEPFVSEGKQKGTGLGLTLAHCVAVEHGGEVVLLSSRPGETVFQMKVARELHAQGVATEPDAKPNEQVVVHENFQI